MNYKHLRFSRIAIAVILLCFLASINARSRENITILATGESHAMLSACDCEQGPAGGFPKRSSLIKECRKKGRVLLLDAGGFSAGGLYDFYTEGRLRDSIRTLAAIEVMAKIGYDAVAIGDEELQFGADLLVRTAKGFGLPIISANCFSKSGKNITEPYRIIKKGDISFGITAVTTTERLFPIDTSVVIEDPIKSIQKFWKKLTKKSDYQIIISHLGEEATSLLADEFPDCDILVNGHRKMGVQPIVTHGKQLIMQFGFQGKSMSSALIEHKSSAIKPITDDWITIEESLPDDSAVTNIVASYENNSNAKATTLDLYLMSQCPYGLPVLKDMLDLSENFPFIELNVWFIGDINVDGSLKSLHGKPEIDEEFMWLAIKNLYPDMWSSFIYLRTNTDRSVNQAISDLEMDTSHIANWVSAKGKEELANHYKRSNRLNVDASPTLFINNNMYEAEISYLRLSRDFCEDTEKRLRPEVCDSLPECFVNSDCRKKGKIGTCVPLSEDEKGGKCVYKEAAKFDFVIVVPDSCLVHSENRAIITTEDLFPGAKIKSILQSSPEGKKLIKELDPASLPLYLFHKKVKKAVNFSKIESGLIETEGWLTFKNDIMKKHFFYKRERKAGAIEIFIDPLFTNINGVLKYTLEKFPGLKRVRISPILYRDINEHHSAEQKVRREEAVRWVVLQERYGNKVFAEYLNAYRLQPGSSYWFSIFKKMNIDVEKFVKKVNESSDLIQKLLEKLNKLEITEPVELLVDNQELIMIKNHTQLKKFLDRSK